MSEGVRTLDPAELPWQDVYARLAEVVVPRPVALVGTAGPGGEPNFAPYSFFTVVSSNPPLVAFSPHRSGRTGQQKESYHNALAAGGFVVAVVDEPLAAAAVACALPPREGAAPNGGLTPLPAERVKAPLVAEAPVNLECELFEVRDYGDGPGAGSLVVGRVVRLHVRESLLDNEGRVAGGRLRAVGCLAGEEWVRTADTFVLGRPGPAGSAG